MKSIGFDDATIGLMVAILSATVILFETPSGILADKWSRKGVLILASIFLTFAGLIGGLSNGVIMYLVAASLWGIFFAMYSGTYNSIIYDTLAEEQGNSTGFQKYIGRIMVADSAALVIGSLLGGVIGEYYGLRSAYFITLPFSLVSIFALIKFKEPTLHKMEVAVPIMQQIKDTVSALARNASLLPIIFVLVVAGLGTTLLLEFNHLWYIALAATVVVFGPANGAIVSSIGLGGWAADKLKMNKMSRSLAVMVAMFVFSLALIYSRSVLVIIVTITLLCSLFFAVKVFFGHILHDNLHSRIRAGADSAVNSISRLLVIPFSLVFGLASRDQSIFTAAWIIFGLAAMMSVVFIRQIYIISNVKD